MALTLLPTHDENPWAGESFHNLWTGNSSQINGTFGHE
jgi:hypothetical protein